MAIPAARPPGAGWEFVHVAVDDHSRVAYVEVPAAQDGLHSAAFLQRAVTWFEGHGIACRRLLTDNGSGYVSRAFRDACAGLGLDHHRTRPYTPRTNGKAERFIQAQVGLRATLCDLAGASSGAAAVAAVLQPPPAARQPALPAAQLRTSTQ